MAYVFLAFALAAFIVGLAASIVFTRCASITPPAPAPPAARAPAGPDAPLIRLDARVYFVPSARAVTDAVPGLLEGAARPPLVLTPDQHAALAAALKPHTVQAAPRIAILSGTSASIFVGQSAQGRSELTLDLAAALTPDDRLDLDVTFRIKEIATGLGVLLDDMGLPAGDRARARGALLVDRDRTVLFIAPLGGQDVLVLITPGWQSPSPPP